MPSTLFGDYSQYNQAPINAMSNPTDSSSWTQLASGFGNTWLGEALGFNAFSDQAAYERDQQMANQQFYRDMVKLDEQNAFNRDEAQKSRDFQERMSNTSYQRAVKDMQLAGINPVLAYQHGGASTPSGATASSGSGGASSGGRTFASKSNALGGILSFMGGMYSADARSQSSDKSSLRNLIGTLAKFAVK